MRHYNTFLRSRNKTAFSLLELSIVIVIIGVLIVGVIGGKHIIKKSRISTAQSLTSSSPISGINDN
ncbi:MAG: prepilin-type N-terminal cleavage/methylation domain-containing protein, partial [Rickettsiales bacterium]|nr:prepilin-type N-terminal cleavage/methylation domain-containing protein [Rickettsiales bacterium]